MLEHVAGRTTQERKSRDEEGWSWEGEDDGENK
jgi:hypothetical protein